MPYKHRRHAGPREDDDEDAAVPETQGLLQLEPRPEQDPDDNELVAHPASPEVTRTFTMGFKDWKQRVAFFQGHAERSPLEKDLVRRLDIYLMTFGCSEWQSPHFLVPCV